MLNWNHLWPVLLTLVMGVLVGVGVRSPASGPAAGPAAARSPFGSTVFGSNGPLNVPGLVPPPLPPGVTLDDRGVIQGLDLAVFPGTKMLAWDTLRSFEYSMAVGMSDMPDTVKAVDGTRVTMVGFLMPNYEYNDIRQFALVGSHWSCCYGMPAGISGTVNVTLAAGHQGLEMNLEPLRVAGTFRAKEIKEEGWLVAIYSLEDATAEPLK